MTTINPNVQEPVGRVVTVGGYPDDSEHTVEWMCKYKDLKDGDLLYATPQPVEQQPAPNELSDYDRGFRDGKLDQLIAYRSQGDQP